MTPACVLSKVYSNSLMVLLNKRSTMRKKAEGITLRETVAQATAHDITQRACQHIQVNIEQETFRDGDRSSTTTVDSACAAPKASYPDVMFDTFRLIIRG